MILVFPQATNNFNKLFKELVNKNLVDDFLKNSLNSYDFAEIDKVILIILEDNEVHNFLNNYLLNSESVKDFEIITLKKETSGSICTTLMAIPSIKNDEVIISALDQFITSDKLKLSKYINKGVVSVISPIFKSSDPSLCYVLKDDQEKVIQLFEKKPVSSEAVLGVYYFENFFQFHKNCHELLKRYKGFKNRTFFTSDVINSYLGENETCKFPLINASYKKIRSVDDMLEII
jgi:dTDP-glucose pyrophosphorylase